MRPALGPRVEVSEIESLAALHQFTFVMHTYAGLVRRRHGARWENQGVYGRYPITLLPCKDGYMSYAVSTEGQWEMLFPMIGTSRVDGGALVHGRPRSVGIASTRSTRS